MKIGVNSRLHQKKGTGIPIYIEYLYREIQKIDTINSYLFFQTEENKKIGKTEIYKPPIKNIIGDVLFDNFLVNNLIEKNKINIFHGISNNLPNKKIKNVKYVLTVYDLAPLVLKRKGNSIFEFYFKVNLGKSLGNADEIVAISNNTKKDIIKFYNVPEEKITVIYPGVKYYLLQQGKGRIVKEKYFFSVTTHPSRKNIISVLKAMSQHEELKKFKYVIVGLIDKDQLAGLKDIIKKLGLINDVVLLGYVSEDQLANLYQNAEFFIYPSFYEGFGFPVLEAMLCKCPVITSNNSSLIEITPNNNWLVDPYNLEDISDKMIRMSILGKEERDELINLNYDFSKQFSWDKTATEYIKLFNDLK